MDPPAGNNIRIHPKTRQIRVKVEECVAELRAQVEAQDVEETHPPTQGLLHKLLAAVDKRDKYRFFGSTPTDDQCPGYSNIIKNPIAMRTMRDKIENDMYASWNEFLGDIILMCANAKAYNHPNTKPHTEADILFKYAMKYVKIFKQGTDLLRGSVALH